jgi:RHS repeat-associated protein
MNTMCGVKDAETSSTCDAHETWHYDGMINDSTGRYSKHVYLNESRIVTKIARADGSFTNEERIKQYYYHSDHLGSAQLISNADGEEYERIEYTPYGELWIEKASAASNIDIPFRFTGKERDEETGLYYYGARYLDSKTSRWLSTDPALGDYIPGAPLNDEARKRNGNLPGMGGVFNTINSHLYHYAGNNPGKYTDPDGRMTNAQAARRGLEAVLPLIDGPLPFGDIAAGALLLYDLYTLSQDMQERYNEAQNQSQANSQAEQAGQNVQDKARAVPSTKPEEGQQSTPDGNSEPHPDYPGNDPAKKPGEGYEWRGKGSPNSGQGNWHNPQTGENLHPDLDHPDPYGPHWDYTDPDGNSFRLYPDGSSVPK